MVFQDMVGFIWSVADLLRGDFKQAEYGKVILPFTVLRRLDCVLEPTKPQVLAKSTALKTGTLPETALEFFYYDITGVPFYNISPFDFAKLKADSENLASNLNAYIQGFSPRARDIIDRFGFGEQITKLEANNLLFMVFSRFADLDLHPDVVSSHEMGYIFEELIRRFSEQSNETAGEHFTPRDVIRLMVDVLFIEDGDALTVQGIIRTLYDCAAGTGGMLSVAEEYMLEFNPDARLEVFGQELNAESFAICNSDMMIKGQDPEHIKYGNSFTQDGHAGARFDYLLTNPPFGVEWKKVEREIRDEYEKRGYDGRFGAGLPRINDGSLLFLQHMISKMKSPEQGGTRLAIVFNGSPLFTGDAGSGESNIRRWIIENDWLEAVIALPGELFYNTGISTYIWVLSNRKRPGRKGKIQLINAVNLYQKMRKSLGNKRNEITPTQKDEIACIYGGFTENDYSKIFNNVDFGYQRITVERPLRLSFQVSPERIACLRESKAFLSLATSKKKGDAALAEIEAGKRAQQEIIDALTGIDALLYTSRPMFEKALTIAFKQAEMGLTAPVKKMLLDALGEKDENADICRDAKGKPEPDADLRDFENVPLKEDIHEYFKREVLPHVSDAWIDESKTKIGYEIPFTRHFYQYQPLRPLEEIDQEIRELEVEIQGMLAEVMG